jgi:broad specificity phosphatase PhoE
LKPKKIYVIRHGQTEYNRKGVVQGRGINAELNELGRKQARAFYEKYKKVDFKKVYTSSLKRSIQSVQGFLEDDIPHEKMPGLDEISWGDSEGKPFDDYLNNKYVEIVQAWRDGDIHRRMTGGESPLDVQKRQEEAMEYILTQDHEDPVLICMHGRAMRILLSWLTNTHIKEMYNFEHNNLGLYRLHYHKGDIQIESRNDVEHLNGLIHEIQ